MSGYPQWFWLCAMGWKDIENRGWPTKYRGRILLHASKHSDTTGYDFIRDRLTSEQWEKFSLVDWLNYAGHIIGEVDIVGCVTKQDAHEVSGRPEELRFNAEKYAGRIGFGNLVFTPWFVGTYGFILANPVLYEKPIPWRGQPGLFNIPCSEAVPCCGRRDEYNGFASGPLEFICPHHCGCHD